jgi:hypothetical protein
LGCHRQRNQQRNRCNEDSYEAFHRSPWIDDLWIRKIFAVVADGDAAVPEAPPLWTFFDPAARPAKLLFGAR